MARTYDFAEVVAAGCDAWSLFLAWNGAGVPGTWRRNKKIAVRGREHWQSVELTYNMYWHHVVDDGYTNCRRQKSLTDKTIITVVKDIIPWAKTDTDQRLIILLFQEGTPKSEHKMFTTNQEVEINCSISFGTCRYEWNNVDAFIISNDSGEWRGLVKEGHQSIRPTAFTSLRTI